MPSDRITTAEEFKQACLDYVNNPKELTRLKIQMYGDATGQLWGSIRWLGYPPCIPRQPHVRDCGDTGDEMFCACGCSGADERCWIPSEE